MKQSFFVGMMFHRVFPGLHGTAAYARSFGKAQKTMDESVNP
jgi:hypothetical protein